MKTTQSKQIVLIASTVLAAIILAFVVIKNRSLVKNLKNEKLNTEIHLSEKLLVEKSLDKMKTDLATLVGKNNELDKKNLELLKQLEAKEAELKRIQGESAAMRSLRARVKELEASISKQKEEHDKAQNSSKKENEKLTTENNDALKSIKTLEKEKEELIAKNTILRAMAGNNYSVEAVRGKNDKLTVRARRTQRLIYTFQLPSDVGNGLHFIIITPEGEKFNSKENKSATINVTQKSDNFFAKNTQLGSVNTKSIEMIYVPSERLGKGEYVFEVYNDNSYIGSSRMRLR